MASERSLVEEHRQFVGIIIASCPIFLVTVAPGREIQIRESLVVQQRAKLQDVQLAGRMNCLERRVSDDA